jgi:hypothetical protein
MKTRLKRPRYTNKNADRIRRFSRVSAHAGGITLFSIPARIARESQKFIFTYPLILDDKISFEEDKKHNVPVSTISNMFDYSFSQLLR